ncbi:unnamed protein product [marine sediment metagenome]|uniref:Uncharacterized protein n=1 Tax=marine sediment metagenome TaxID=412755 RepID=X0SPX2_9ZZZZ
MKLGPIERLMIENRRIRARVPGGYGGPAANLPWTPRGGAGVGWDSYAQWRRAAVALVATERAVQELIADGLRDFVPEALLRAAVARDVRELFPDE